LTESARIVPGVWTDGDYRALAGTSRQVSLDFVFALGVRPADRFELGADVAYGRQSVSALGFASQQTGFGDLSLHVRYEAIDEPMPFEQPPLLHPSLAMIVGLRTPSGSLELADARGEGGAMSGTTGSAGASASSQSLGAWEPSIAVELRQTEKARYQLSFVGEGAYRFPDSRLGVDRHLGPRLLAQLNFRYIPSAVWGVGALTDLGWEDAVSIDGMRHQGSGQRLWSVGLYGYVSVAETGFRAGAMVRHAPPLSGVSVNAVGATTLAVSVGYAL
jgi:hypothetical protein